jgi:hypothetical protein
MRKDLERRLEDLEATASGGDNESCPFKLHLFWDSEAELTSEQREENKQARAWLAQHPNSMSAEVRWCNS